MEHLSVTGVKLVKNPLIYSIRYLSGHCNKNLSQINPMRLFHKLYSLYSLAKLSVSAVWRDGTKTKLPLFPVKRFFIAALNSVSKYNICIYMCRGRDSKTKFLDASAKNRNHCLISATLLNWYITTLSKSTLKLLKTPATRATQSKPQHSQNSSWTIVNFLH